MSFLRRSYDESYYDGSLLSRNPFLKIDIRNKLELISSFKRSGSLLEIGCGDGKLLTSLKGRYDVAGTDLSEYAIRKAAGSIDKNKLKVSDIEREAIRGKYDIIVAFDVLEHLRSPKAAIAKIRKSLKQGGILIFSVPNNYGIFGNIMTRIFNYLDSTHVSTLKREEWIQLVKDSNMTIEKTISQSPLGFFESDIAKHFSFNLVVVAGRE